ncbi:ABC transporter permease [Marinicrinis lubricantis]|uniref:ABC transporter permease n=1 Tax=Marinicrinis lubricantis TaxID=2086470 RepID=A0ABW1ILR9_9BACL
MNELFQKVWILYRFIWRRDWLRIFVWIAAITFFTVLIAISLNDLYPTDADKAAIAATMENPAMTAMIGKSEGLDHYTTGAMVSHQMLLFTAIAVAIMNILIIIRHTRNDEEEGRLELLRSLPTGRLSQPGAAIFVALTVNVLLSMIVGLALFALNIESIDFSGSMLYGTALGASGLLFATAAAFFAQLTENSRGASGYSFAVLIAAYLIRAAGDVGSEWLSWLSPLGWVMATNAYVHNDWIPVFLMIFTAAALTALAFYMNSIRDIGAGLLPSKPGKEHASKSLLSPFGLAFRLGRTGFIAWAVGMLVLGMSYGSVLGDVESFANEIEMLIDALPQTDGVTLREQFIAMILSIMSMICTIPALMSLLKLKGEEKRNRTEHLLSRVVSRAKLLGGYSAMAWLSSICMLFLAAFGLWIAGEAAVDGGISFITVMKGAFVYLPAMWLMIAISVWLFGMFPKYTGFVWLYLGYSFFTVYMGGMLQLPEWIGKLSPFGNVPMIPVEELSASGFILLLVLVALFMAAGVSGYNRRDVHG